MEIKTKYITPDDFKDYFGIDLDLELKALGNPSNTANAFIMRIEDRMAAFLDAEFYRRIDVEYPTFNDYQKEHYSKALLEQAMYVFKNGDISVDSGYNMDTGETATITSGCNNTNNYEMYELNVGYSKYYDFDISSNNTLDVRL